MPIEFGQYSFQTKEENGKMFIFDIVRKKYVRLTPEEVIRQTVVHYFVKDLNYPKKFISVEKGLVINELQKRTDVVIYNQSLRPKILVECKQPKVELNQKTIDQAALYNLKLKVPYLILTNGTQGLMFKIDFGNQLVASIETIPLFQEL